MPATVIIRRWTGDPPSYTDITSINTVANAVDSHQAVAATSNNAIPVPSESDNLSFWVSTRLYVQSAPAGFIDNIRWYTDGSNNMGTGITCKVGVSPFYLVASGTAGSSGDPMIPSHSGITATLTAFSYTSGTPLSVSGVQTLTGDVGDFIIYQVGVGALASAGTTGQESFTFVYDET